MPISFSEDVQRSIEIYTIIAKDKYSKHEF